ncbi:cytochrome-c peroxidase [Nitrosomonas sp. Is37]|uniref:cytochrome-c peroxidase n=1 Tax=Nitrosomonas sp. Is37 TaxID=3080535 RepID=UPI00294B1456|nr:cytochrome-c peroxidase [Nitrosomonas sp. Is37]MDV6345492.1 cytochrome-c peroxidase [Nitrosomonas sp. Is37]
MKLILFLALILSTHVYAQDSHQHHHGGTHNGDHHGGMHSHDHGQKVDAITLKLFFEPLPDSIIDQKKNATLIKLGRILYMDPRLSVNDKIACNSCHLLNKFGVDNEPTSPGHEGKRGGRNAPTTLNAALHIAQFWDGRAKDVEEQALGPILNPIEMGMPSEAAVINKLKKIDEYKELFPQAFKDEKEPFQYKNVGKAIGAFERTLLTPSRFDEFLKGNENALKEDEKRGLKKFIDMGCVHCHNGVAIGGNSFKKLGIVEPYETKDMGRYEVTGIEIDKKVFKVPSLRNITKTGPYFHDGSVKTLDQAIREMAEHQLGQEVDDQFVKDVKAFLGSLTAKDME